MFKDHRSVFWSLLAGAFLLGAVLLWNIWGDRVSDLPVRAMTLTGYPGREIDPDLSPEGQKIAFAWNGETQENFDIYVRARDSGDPLRLTEHPAMDRFPVWSPNGESIAFLRSGNGGGIFIIPSAGGMERKIYSGQVSFGDIRNLSWSSDGKFLAFVGSDSPEASDAVFLLAVETGARSRLTSPAPQTSDAAPRFSPDGESIAFLRSSSEYWVGDIYRVPLTGGEPRRLTFDNQSIMDLAWTPDGREIIFSSPRGGGGRRLWKVSASGSTPRPLAIGGENAFSLSIGRQKRLLAYERRLGDADIYAIELNSHGGDRSPSKLIASTQGDFAPQFSPDGTKIAFDSRRSGTSEIWVCESDGSNPKQLTSLGYDSGLPCWAPDGKKIAFVSRPEGHGDVFVSSVDGGVLRRMTESSSDDVVTSWSRDGKWIYFDSDRSGSWQVWKMPAQGGEPVQVTRLGSHRYAYETSDGRHLYYQKLGLGIWKMPLAGGQEELVFKKNLGRGRVDWILGNKGIYFADGTNIQFFDLSTSEVGTIARAETDPRYLAVSPNDRLLLYRAILAIHSDIILVENFQ